MQRNAYDCGVAMLATIFNAEYEEIAAKFPRNLNDEVDGAGEPVGVLPSEIEWIFFTKKRHIYNVPNKFTAGDDFDDIQKHLAGPLPDAISNFYDSGYGLIMGLIRNGELGHWVYMESGLIYDPAEEYPIKVPGEPIQNVCLMYLVAPETVNVN